MAVIATNWERVFQGGFLILLTGVSAVLEAAASNAASIVSVDQSSSLIGFEIRTRYGQVLKGHFKHFDGRVEILSDGRQRISMTLDARSAEIPGHARYTRWMQGEDFFNAGTFPVIVFDSAAYSPSVVKRGGEVQGWLNLRGVRGPVRMQVDSAVCARPGYDCAVTGRGEVSRAAHGMERWNLAVGDRVTFVMKVRLSDAGSL